MFLCFSHEMSITGQEGSSPYSGHSETKVGWLSPISNSAGSFWMNNEWNAWSEWHMSLSLTTYWPKLSHDPTWGRGEVQEVQPYHVPDRRRTGCVWWTVLPICKCAQNQAEWGPLKACCLYYSPLFPPPSPNLRPGISTADHSFCRK